MFLYANEKRLIRQHLTRELRYLLSRLGLNSSNYAGRSFCIGAATSTAASGLPLWLIKTLGRWISDCFETYISTPISVFCQATQKLGSTCTLTPSVTAQQNRCHMFPLLQLQIACSIRSNIPLPISQSLIIHQNKSQHKIFKNKGLLLNTVVQLGPWSLLTHQL